MVKIQFPGKIVQVRVNGRSNYGQRWVPKLVNIDNIKKV